jgi:hypothetical protein
MMVLYLILAFMGGIAFMILTVPWVGNSDIMREETTDDEKMARGSAYNQIYRSSSGG